MPDKTAAQKMRLKPGMTVAVLDDESGIAAALGADDVTFTGSTAGADAVLLFVTRQDRLEARLPGLASALAPATALWVVYPKGSKAAGRDISRDTIWPVAESLGMRPVGMVSIDDTWSGFRLKVSG